MMSNGKLIIVCGEPGVGKSSVAEYIAKLFDIFGNCHVLATDEIRKELFGPEPEYTKEESQATYDEMFDRARLRLQENENVVLDATFMLQRGRERANRLAQEHTEPYNFTIVRVTCDPDTAKRRIRQREESASDADVQVYHSIRDRFEPIELPHVTIDNSDSWWQTREKLSNKEL